MTIRAIILIAASSIMLLPECLAATDTEASESASTNASRAVNGGWTYSMVTSYMSQIGTLPKDYVLQMVTNAATVEKIPVPQSAEQMLRYMYTFSLTNLHHEAFVLDIITHTTNEAMADILLWGYTNGLERERSLPYTLEGFKRKWEIEGFHQESLTALRHIGTPAVIDRLNKVQRAMLPKNSKRGPSNTIDPDDYPEEAKRWLFEYPERNVRLSMAKEWLLSSRPETPALIRQHIKWLKTLPEDIPYWSADPGESWKKDELKTMERQAKEYEVRYQRWIEDGKHKNINAGSYTDEYWEGYKKEREAERAKEREAQTNMSTSPTVSKQ